MAEAALDENYHPTLTGVSSADGVTIVRCRVDPVTNYLLATIHPIADFATTNPPLKIDENDNRVGAAITNDSNQTIKPLLADPNNTGYLLADVTLI